MAMSLLLQLRQRTLATKLRSGYAITASAFRPRCGDLIGSGEARERGIAGETPNLAARLQALAEPGAIVVAENTRRQIGTLFELVDLGPQQLKGFAEAQRAWRVAGENRALGRFEALRMSAAPLVGREEELELLLRRWAQSKIEGERVVVLSAEAGISKSRLADALRERG